MSLFEDVLLLDEVSMIDEDCFQAVMQTMSLADHTRRPEKHEADEFGCAHVVLFGDFKQLPPATSKAGPLAPGRLWRDSTREGSGLE